MTRNRKLVCVVNGYPNSGKDTFVAMVQAALEGWGTPSRCFSSIEGVRQMLRMAGFPVDRKTPEIRALLAEVGDAVERFDHRKSKDCIAAAAELFGIYPVDTAVIFLMVREPPMIRRIAAGSATYGWDFTSVFVERDVPKVVSNSADLNVEDYAYQHRIPNHGSLENLRALARQFAEYILMPANQQAVAVKL